MSKVDPTFYALIAEWQEAVLKCAEARAILAREMELRRMLAATVFPAPKEGTNRAELTDGFELKYNYSIDRDVDKAVLPAVAEQVRAAFNINTDELIRNKPELALAKYRELPDDARKMFDQALKIKPGTPTLEIVAPKKK